jgi:predicted NAD/FAD-binding protein
MIHFFHKWEIKGVQPMEMRLSPVVAAVWNFNVTDQPSEPVTQVLQVCKVCGKLRTETLHGNWTWNDLVGGNAPANAIKTVRSTNAKA